MPVRIEPGSEPIPGYKLIDRLGGGGFGEVWKCEAPGGLLKAIKVVYGDLQTTDADGTRRAEQELKALRRVQTVRHPYLLSLERYDIVEGRLLIVMELADRNLWDRFRECRGQNQQGIPRDELLRYIEETAEVLDLMNSTYQLQHLDIKPQNLFLVHNHAKVADFGLVKDLEGMMATVTGGITPVYAAPETFDGVVSRFCDQYSLAIVYQELLTGQRPFSGSSLQQLIMQHLSATPNVTPLPKPDRGAIMRSLSKKPEGRYPTCLELVRALRSAGTVEAVAVKPSPMPTPATTERPGIGSSIERTRRPEPTLDNAARLIAESTKLASVEETGPPVQDMPPSRLAPPEQKGDGVLFPALIIGLGKKGLETLLTLRESIEERFGALSALPNLRLMYIDTDPDTAHAAAHGAGGIIDPSQIILTRLNRPSHYIKAVGGRSPIESWFNSKLLYRMQRNPLTTGIRALGRLAFVDNYRTIVQRMQAELGLCSQPDVLNKANRHTRLGVRSNYPRVYVIAGLAGGTGSGMFLDVAYVAAQQLRQLGYITPEVTGICYVPDPADRQSASTVGLGNTYAALTELNHFSQPGVSFSFKFDDREAKLKDRDPPFRRTVIVPLEPERSPERAGEATRLVGDFLFRELATPLGRTAEANRVAAAAKEGADAGAAESPTCQSMNLYRFTWPRRTLLQRAARHLCHELSQHWMAKDATPVKDAVRTWLAEELTRQELDPDHLVARLQGACTQTMGESPDAIFNSLVEPFVPKGRRPTEPEPNAVLDAVRRMEQLTGRPKDDPAKVKDMLLAGAMDSVVGDLVKTWGEKLAQIVLGLVEQPDFRLAGAEEALKQLSDTIGRTLEHHEALYREVLDRAVEGHTRVLSHVETFRANPGARRNAPLIPELAEALRAYAKNRYQALQLRRVADIYVSLRGQLSEQVREVNFCRNRLGELVRFFEDAGGSSHSFEPVPGMCLLPSGCRSVEDAIQRLLDTLTPRDLKDLDRQLQDSIEEQFTSLVQVCLASDDVVRELGAAIQQQAENFMGNRLVGTNVVEMFLTQRPRPEEAIEDIAVAFKDAKPRLTEDEADESNEIRILALPPGPLGEQFRSLAQKALPDAGLTVTESTEDIVIYRERPNVPLSTLRVLGPNGQAAYQHMSNSETFPAHSRNDITEWQEFQ
jgi:serine/threonine protein kinase